MQPVVTRRYYVFLHEIQKENNKGELNYTYLYQINNVIDVPTEKKTFKQTISCT